MTKDEYKVATNCTADIAAHNEYAATERYVDSKDEDDCFEPSSYLNHWKGVNPRVSLEWTHDDKLWRMQLTYTVPDESPWETMNGKRVPHYINADIGFQVIHLEVPSIEFSRDRGWNEAGENAFNNEHKFYGLTKKLMESE